MGENHGPGPARLDTTVIGPGHPGALTYHRSQSPLQCSRSAQLRRAAPMRSNSTPGQGTPHEIAKVLATDADAPARSPMRLLLPHSAASPQHQLFERSGKIATTATTVGVNAHNPCGSPRIEHVERFQYAAITKRQHHGRDALSTNTIAFTTCPPTGGMTAEAAYEVVKGPLMALIGGSLAISKDLIPLGIGSEIRQEHTDKDYQ